MWKSVSLALCVVLALPATGLADNKILEFETMVGVTGPFLGPANPIRGVNGAGAAWTLTKGVGRLGIDGLLQVQVRRLVLVRTGANPVANFRAIVSCLTIDVGGNAVTSNVVTGPFPATPEGDADFEAVVVLPSPCIAPIVFVAPTNDPLRWFAVTGH